MSTKHLPPLTSLQVRAARAILRWTTRDLSERAKVATGTINRLEQELTSTNHSTLIALRQAFETAGVEFIENHGVSYRGLAAPADIEDGQ